MFACQQPFAGNLSGLLLSVHNPLRTFWVESSTMASALEGAIRRLQEDKESKALVTLLDCFDGHVPDLLALRAAHWKLGSIPGLERRAFATIYLHALSNGLPRDVNALKSIGPHCQHLFIKIAYRTSNRVHPALRAQRNPQLQPHAHSRVAAGCRFETRMSQAQDGHNHEGQHSPRNSPREINNMHISSPCTTTAGPVAWKSVLQRRPNKIDQAELNEWMDKLGIFTSIATFTIACNGDFGWPGTTDVEINLIMIRICLERLNFPYLKRVRLVPIHAMGIMHFRWDGLGAYGHAPGTGSSDRKPSCPSGMIWQMIDRLDLTIPNPFIKGRLTDSHREVFEEVLLDYLRSFRPTLKVLSIAWRGGNSAPCPLLLSQRAHNDGLSCVQKWCRLEEIWLANTALGHDALGAIRAQAPALKRIMVIVQRRQGAGFESNENDMVTVDNRSWRNMLTESNTKQAHQVNPADREVSDTSDVGDVIQIGLDVSKQ